MIIRKRSKFSRKLFQILSSLIIGILVTGLVPGPVLGRDSAPKEFSLQSAQNFAITHSYDSKRTQLDIQTAQKQMKETLAIGLPQIESSIGYLNNLKIATVLIPNFFEGKFDEMIPVQFGTQHNTNLNLMVSQLLFNGSYFVGLQAAKIYKQLANQNHERTQQNIIETVTNTYYLILVTTESELILNGNLSNLEKTLYEIKELNKEGFVSETDADLVQISVTKLKNTLQTINRQKDVAYKLLKFQMGLDLNEEILLTDKLDKILERIDLNTLQSSDFSLEDNIDYNLLKTQEKLSEMDLKNEKMKYLPTVAAFMNFQWNAMRNSFNFFSPDEKWYQTQLLGVNVNVPIFKSGAQKARVQKAAIALKQAQNAKQQAAEGLSLEAASAKSDLDSAYENYTHTQENMELSNKVYDVTLVKYKEGVASSMDLTQAHNTFLLAQSEFIQAMSMLLTAKNKMDRLNSNY
ncbi:TolC family protein [Acidobacteriota bacterium]